MSYVYSLQRPNLFTEQGQVMFTKIRDNTLRLIAQAGAVRLIKAISGCTGDTWDMIACMDRMVELKEIREITGPNVAGQDRVFVKVGE